MTALFGLSIVARLPMAMLSIGLLVHTQAATGEYSAAGLVAGWRGKSSPQGENIVA